jgi:hypothetical protein
MKKAIKSIFLIITIVLFSATLNVLSAQPSGPPSGGPNGGHDLGGNQGEGGGAPINGGLVVSLAMVAAFGAWKWVNGELRKKQSDHELK